MGVLRTQMWLGGGGRGPLGNDVGKLLPEPGVLGKAFIQLQSQNTYGSRCENYLKGPCPHIVTSTYFGFF